MSLRLWPMIAIMKLNRCGRRTVRSQLRYGKRPKPPMSINPWCAGTDLRTKLSHEN